MSHGYNPKKGVAMKTLFIVSSKRVNAHAGEEYDYILEVEHQPTTETILNWANRIKDAIRALWHEQIQAGEKEPKVVVYLDAAGPFVAMLINLQIIMGAEEQIVLELPQFKDEVTVSDPEAVELLKKLDGK